MLLEDSHLFDTEAGRDVDFYQLLSSAATAESYLPELYDVIGAEAFEKFLSVFEGMTLEIPTQEQLGRTLREMDVYFILRRTDRGFRSDAVAELAKRHRKTTGDIRRIFHRVEQRMAGYRAKLGA